MNKKNAFYCIYLFIYLFTLIFLFFFFFILTFFFAWIDTKSYKFKDK